MKNFLSESVVIFVSISIACGGDVVPPCGDDGWIPYKNEKCVKLFQTFETQHRAEEVCRLERSSSDASVPTLVSIRSLEEQKFLQEFVFNSSDSTNIWIGAKRRPETGIKFAWTDDSPVQTFIYWDIHHPTADTMRSCVILQSELSSRRVSDSRWIDVNCTTRNWFICEKLQASPIEPYQQTVLSRDLQYKVDRFTKQYEDMQKAIDDLKNELAAQATTLVTQGAQLRHLQENPVPIGFVYVQLSRQPEPQNMWPTVRWTEITPTYAGLFFRAAGGNAAAFGSTQSERSPRLNGVNRRNLPTNVNHIWPIPLGNWSEVISTGTVSNSDRHSGLQFSLSNVEVRPRNQAVRIWQRIE